MNDRPVACQTRGPTRRETGSSGGRTPVSLPLEGAPVLTLGCAQLKVSPKGADEVSFVSCPAAASSLPLEGFAVLNDTPVACQTRGPTRRETGVSEADG